MRQESEAAWVLFTFSTKNNHICRSVADLTRVSHQAMLPLAYSSAVGNRCSQSLPSQRWDLWRQDIELHAVYRAK